MCVVTECKFLKKKKKKKKIVFFFLRLGIGKKSPKSHWERGRISAPEDTKKNPRAVWGLQIMEIGSRVVHSLLHFSERWPCHIWLVGRMKFASLEANLGWGRGVLVFPILLFFLPLSGRSPNMN